jgi:nicotinamidase-related amidase
MKKYLIVTDMQNDFIDGALGTPEAVAIVPSVCEKIRSFDGDIIVTMDTHGSDYMKKREGRFLPVEHCIKGTEGWDLSKEVKASLYGKNYRVLEKVTFGSVDLPKLLKDLSGEENFEVHVIGLCTDICVVSNAMIVKASFPEADIYVDAACCAGVSPESHRAALQTMKSCQMIIENEE